MYAGLDINDQVKLKWNSKTIANQEQSSTQAEKLFHGGMPELDSTLLSSVHQAQMKVDLILILMHLQTHPVAGDKVQTPKQVPCYSCISI